MATAADYGINFAYGAQDGYWYGPDGRVGKYHRGNDRPCPTGTPVVINGHTIGLTGASGLVSGPHLHTQACSAGSGYSDDFNPGPYEFKNGQVVGARWHHQFGNHIVVRVGGVDITYAHLSKINVAVGQQAGGNVADKLQLGPARILAEGILGRNRDQAHAGAFDGDLNQHHVGRDLTNGYLQQLWESPEARAAAGYETAAKNFFEQYKNVIGELSSRPSREELNAVNQKLLQSAVQVEDALKALEEEKAKVKEVTVYTHDNETKENVSKLLSLVTTIFNYFAGQYKSFSRYIKK